MIQNDWKRKCLRPENTSPKQDVASGSFRAHCWQVCSLGEQICEETKDMNGTAYAADDQQKPHTVYANLQHLFVSPNLNRVTARPAAKAAMDSFPNQECCFRWIRWCPNLYF